MKFDPPYDSGFFVAAMPASRPADYYLGYADGSVYMDFNDTVNGICLIRISFDGYGCCSFAADSIPLPAEESELFRKILKSTDLNQKVLGENIRKAIWINRGFIWEEALEEYGLI